MFLNIQDSVLFDSVYFHTLTPFLLANKCNIEIFI